MGAELVGWWRPWCRCKASKHEKNALWYTFSCHAFHDLGSLSLLISLVRMRRLTARRSTGPISLPPLIYSDPLRAVVHLAGSDGASKDPELQRLVRFGGSAVCCGLAVDSQSNIYVGIKEGWGTEVANVILVKEDQVVQLPMEVEEMEGIAVAPDGQILYIWDGEGNVLRWEQPWAAVDGQVVATVEEYGIFRCVADGTGLWIEKGDGHLLKLDAQRHTPVLDVKPTTAACGFCVPGIGQDGAAVLYCNHKDTAVACINTETAAVSPVPVVWPTTHVKRAVVAVLGCNSDGALLVAAGPRCSNNLFTRLYHVAPGGQATVVLQLEGVSNDSFDSDETLERTFSRSYHRDQDEDREGRDTWEGCTWAEAETKTRHVRLERCCLDANGHLVGITAKGVLVRVLLTHSVQPAHLQQLPTRSNVPGSCKDWASLLGSEEGTDVQLRCAEGAVVEAHSSVLLARWEYYRLLQRNVAAGMSGSAGEVDVREHSAATMHLVLQHLYIDSLQLPELVSKVPKDRASGAEQAGPSAAAGQPAEPPTSKQSRKRDADGALKQDTRVTVTAAADDSGQQEQWLWQLASLMQAADALLLPDLHGKCLKIARQQLTPQNALSLLLAAHEARVEALQKAILLYVVRNIRAVRSRSASPLTIRDVCRSAPELGAELAHRLAFLA